MYNSFGIEEVKEENHGWFECYKEFKEAYQHEPKLNEIRLYSKIYEYAGTIDNYGLVLGLKTVGDYKTFATVNQTTIDKVGLQLAAYRQLLIEQGHEVEQGLMIHLRNGKKAKLYFYTSEQLDDYFEKFIQMLNYKKLIKKLGGK